ncbi:MAG: hypothetical protein GEU96_07690 [Propionibacteriales bacterium]|nr:hypothetical protein [Propionibacteriales bacterium]
MGSSAKSPSDAAARSVMLSGPFLGLAALAMLEWADWGAHRDSGARGGASALAVWEFLITASVVAWAFLAGVGLRLLGALDELDAAPPEPDRSRARRRIETTRFVVFVYIVLAVVLAAGGIAGLRNPFVITGQDWKIPLLHLLAGAANVPLLVCLKRIQLNAADQSRWSTSARDVARLRLLRRATHQATVALGVVIALAVIATGALSQATEAAGLTPLPDTFALVYGASFTGVVAALYLHVYGALEVRGRWMLDTAAPPLDPSPESAEAFASRRSLRSELAQELELGGDPRGNLEGLLAVLAPLAGALLSQLGGL